MPLDETGKYYLDDAPRYTRYGMMDSVYSELKTICENDTRSQEAFNGIVAFMDDCGYTMQKSIIHLLKEGSFDIFKR